MRIINQSRMYNKKPSEMLNIQDEYIAYCFDEACIYIFNKIQDGDIPSWIDEKNTVPENNNNLIKFMQNHS